jgi:hypothetical protein
MTAASFRGDDGGDGAPISARSAALTPGRSGGQEWRVAMDGNETCSRPTMPPGDDERAKAADSPPIASYRDPTPDTRVVTWLDGEDLRIFFFSFVFFFPFFFPPARGGAFVGSFGGGGTDSG